MKTKKTRLKRTQLEIVNRIRDLNKSDFLGFETSELIVFLDFKYGLSIE